MSGARERILRSSGAWWRSGRASRARARAYNLTITTPPPILVPSLLAPPFPSEPLLEHLRPSRLPRVRLELVPPSRGARPAAAATPPAAARGRGAALRRHRCRPSGYLALRRGRDLVPGCYRHPGSICHCDPHPYAGANPGGGGPRLPPGRLGRARMAV